MSVTPVTSVEETVELPDGRRLAYAARGGPGGSPVLFHHGTPGSRLGRHPDPALPERLGVRVVNFDRPGYGGSDRLEGRSVSAIAGDAAALADHLGWERFGVMGVSGGGPHALACAALLPERISRVAVLVTPAPYEPGFDFLAGMAQTNIDEFSAALTGPAAIAAYLAPSIEALQTEPGQVLDQLAAELPPPDQELLARPEVRELVIAAWQEATRQGDAGWLDDDLAFTRPWGFELGAIHTEARLWHGELDALAPQAHGRRVAEALPAASFELVSGQGHLLYDAWPLALEWLAAAA
ncbi:MAG TPA: alpha/beta hydrolase [Gaiellaceae bacterium]